MTCKEVAYALRTGELVRADVCEQCGKSSVENGRGLDGHHHRGYAPEHMLDLQWLCMACHGRAHGAPSAQAKRTPEERSALARKMAAAALARSTPEQRSERARAAGRVGGRARAAGLTADQRAAISRKAGQAAQAKISHEEQVAKGRYIGQLRAATGARDAAGRFRVH